MQRREFITLLGGAVVVWPLAARAQQAARIYRLGTLTPGLPISATSPLGAVLLGELARLGYTLGQNLAFDARAAGGEKSKLPQLLQDFQASGIDAIVVAGYSRRLPAIATSFIEEAYRFTRTDYPGRQFKLDRLLDTSKASRI